MQLNKLYKGHHLALIINVGIIGGIVAVAMKIFETIGTFKCL